jgi:DNA repair exonuclease SbcCD nuclease subunit
MKILRLGDPHVKPNNIKESDALMVFVFNKCKELKVDRLEILGDLADTHSILRLEVLEFWQNWIRKLSKNKIQTIILRGNHDVGGDYSNDYSWLHVFGHLENITIVIDPIEFQGIGYMPYIHDNKEFVEKANELAKYSKVLVSHTTYQGSKYDNGMYAPDGVDPDLLDPSFTSLITGHVHSEQEFGRVWYPGTARWLSKSCANRRKGIWLCEHADDGTLLSKEFISTESVCTPIISLNWKEGQEKPVIPANAKVDIELIGSSEWVTKTKKELIGSVSVSSKITDTKKSKERKSGKSLYEFLSKHYETNKREKLISYMKGLDLV